MISWDYEVTKSTHQIFQIRCMHQVLLKIKTVWRIFFTWKDYINSWFHHFSICRFSSLRICWSCKICSRSAIYRDSHQKDSNKVHSMFAALSIFFRMKMITVFAYSLAQLKNAKDDAILDHYFNSIKNMIYSELNKTRLHNCNLKYVCLNHAIWKV